MNECSELHPVRDLVIAGNLMEVALRNPQHFARDEMTELANTWSAALARLRESLMPLIEELRYE